MHSPTRAGKACFPRRRLHTTGAGGRPSILNARLARSQLLGGMVWGTGMALTEHAVYDTRTGRLTTRDLADCHVPVNADVGGLDAVFLEDEHDEQVDPAGVKGIGEIGITGAAAAIANAVFDATASASARCPSRPTSSCKLRACS